MKPSLIRWPAALLLAVSLAQFAVSWAQPVAPLPQGVRAVWDSAKAFRETTPTRERVCINGLWQWQPAQGPLAEVPATNWGHFKVPGAWPGITDYMQKDSQTVYAHPAWKDLKLSGISAAWYEREISVPAAWAGRRVLLAAEYVNSFAVVCVDGKKAGELRFPGGDLDITAVCQPGGSCRLALYVVAMPLKGVMLSYIDSASAREVKGSVARRGLCGDVFLVSTPRGPRIGSVQVDTSVRRKELTVGAEMEGIAPEGAYSLLARIFRDGQSIKEFKSPSFTGADLKENRFGFTEKWMPDRLWDLNTPINTCELQLSLVDAAGAVLDTAWPARFGFRELWIDGRDFYLNGTRIYLSAVPFDNAQISAGLASYAGARESLERLKSFGINFVYTHNYDCLPGSHLGFAELLRAADDAGVLVSLTQPHFSHYDWKTPEADQTNGYAGHAAWYARAAGNHPSVVMYAMNHNSTGYSEDMNPALIDGLRDPRENWSARNAKVAVRTEAIVKRLDPSRVVYHHASGNLGSMHPVNFYPNFAPVQELSDWFGHWAGEGVKPVFLCEYGAPFTWDWTMYRGWYKGRREFGSAAVPWEFCLAEWNAQFFGDRAFKTSAAEKANLRWEAKQYRAGKVWNRWDYPNQVGSAVFDERYPVFAMYLSDNWRAFRTWGVSAISPWEHGHFWKLREGVDTRRQILKTDWETLQRPGFSADYIDGRYERMDLAYERSDWVATPAAEALLRNNRPLLGWIAGKPAAFTSKDHVFNAGESVEKQIVVINNSREPVTCDCEWTLSLPQPATGAKRVAVATGQQERIPLRFELPQALKAGRYELRASFKFSSGVTQADVFFIDVLEPAAQSSFAALSATTALFDPKGETRALLERAGIRIPVADDAIALAGRDLLIVGKGALTLAGPALDLRRVRDGLKVLVFEQTSEALERRLGFRVQEYGLRQVFARIPDHPALAGLDAEHLRDWRGEATILPAQLKYELNPAFNGAPTVSWCGLASTRVWRCGNRGNAASVLIEKPARGNFRSVVDGGFGLEYSPLLEYREGKGMVVFCQLDVTGRTERDPVAEVIARNLLQYAANWKPAPERKVYYAGEDAGRTHLESTGITTRSWDGGALLPSDVLVVGPGGGRALAGNKSAINDWLKAGGNLLGIGLDQSDATALLSFDVTMRKAEHISAAFDAFKGDSLFAGVSPADVHNRDPREMPLVTGGAEVIGDGVLARARGLNVVFCQLAPWQFDGSKQANLRRTQRRATVLVSRLLANMGVSGATPLLERFQSPVAADKPEKRWLTGLYMDTPQEWDDPYRFFRW